MPEPGSNSFESLCNEGRQLLQRSGHPSDTHREFHAWDAEVAKWLDKQFPNSGLSAEWSSLSSSRLVVGGHYYNDDRTWSEFHLAVRQRLAWLGQLGRAMQSSGRGSGPVAGKSPAPSKRVFLVHGRNEGIREKVARFLEKLGLEPIILHEQPNKGRTVIEKFTDYSNVFYAVVLLTADDIGGVAGTPVEDLVSRARQNVIFELGFFLGRLGREKVCALYEQGVDILSDYAGVLYITLDAGDVWRMHLARR
jgi:hypothetical protein